MRYYPDTNNKNVFIDVPIYYEENYILILEKYNKKAKEIENEMKDSLSNN